MRKILLLGIAVVAMLHAEVTVIRNATIMTEGGKGTIKGSILVRDGKIAEVGENIAVPEGAAVIDANGQWVIPGIIDCHTHIAIDGNGNVWAANSGANSLSEFSSAGTPLTPAAGYAGDGLNGPLALAIDAAGNLWVINDTNSSSSVSEFIGLASPVKTPLLGLPQRP